VFHRGINFNGPAITIDGNAWEASATAVGFTQNGWQMSGTTTGLSPATDANRAAMLTTAFFRDNMTWSLIVPNGTYQVSVYTWENDWPEVFSLALEGVVRISNYDTVGAGHWSKLGPYTVTVTDGVLNASTTGWASNISGMEVFRVT
jgi:hypothetical protein